jgi:hypothetical protein
MAGSDTSHGEIGDGDVDSVGRQGVGRRLVSAVRGDRVYRTSVLLIGDNLALGLLGGLLTLIVARHWSPAAIGIVAAITGALGPLTTAAALGLPSTVVAYLAGERDQALALRGALTAVVSVGVILLAIVWFLPHHLGLPVSRLGLAAPVALLMLVLYVACSLIVAVCDPAFLARQEVGWTVGKDMTSMAVRYAAMLALIGSGARGLFLIDVIYTCTAAIIDLALIRWRLHRAPRPRFTLGLHWLRTHARFAGGAQVATLVAMLPTALLPVFVLARLGATSAGFVAVAMQILGVLTIVPSMTASSLFAELAAYPDSFVEPIRKALRAAYLVTLPLALLMVVAAPWILGLFGPVYAEHSVGFLRWGAAGSIFFCFNYVSDIVLLGRKRVAAYVVVNVAGTVAVLVSVWVALGFGLDALGPGWFVGQAGYCVVSIIVLARYVGLRKIPATFAAMVLP